VTFVYYRCPGICSPLLSEVAKMIDKMDLEIGKDYQVFTLSFDPAEKPEMASEKRQNYLTELKKKIDPAGWRFFTGDSADIRRLTDAAGFYYQRSGRDWVHAATLIVLSPSGKITRYLYGIQHLPFDVKMAVVEASEGRTGPTIAKVLRFCYAYDPEGRTYALAVTRIAGVAVLGLAALFAAIFIVRPRKRKAPDA
jgi:protein SCO1/2